MRWTTFAAIPLGAACLLLVISVSAALADSTTNPGTEVPATAPAPPQPPGPPPSIDVLEAQMLSMINSERAAAGVAPVQSVAWAHGVAEQHSQAMAAAGNIFHNFTGFMDQGRAALGATYLGENVAMDSTLAADDALLYSDLPHRDITLDARFNFVGVGIALDASNWVFVTEDFAQIPGAAAPTVAPVRPAAAPAVAKAAAAKVPVAVASTKPVATTKPAAPAPTAPTAAAKAAAPASPKVQPIAAKPVSHSTHMNGGIWLLVGLGGLALAGFSFRHLLSVLLPPKTRNAARAPVYSLGAPQRSSPWRRAA